MDDGAGGGASLVMKSQTQGAGCRVSVTNALVVQPQGPLIDILMEQTAHIATRMNLSTISNKYKLLLNKN